MAKKEPAFRFKIYLVKDECVDDELEKESKRFAPFQHKNIDGTLLFYRQSNISVPKWYRDFFKQNDKQTIFSSSVSAYFCRDIKIDGNRKKFVVVFGGGESGLNLEKFDDNFGLRIALNLADSFVNLKKNNISTTQSKTREQATKGQNVSSFGIDFEKDMIEGVTVLPKENNISEANISGAMHVSISKIIDISQIDDLLIECYKLSSLTDYQVEFPFINNIKEIKQNKTVITELNKIIVSAFNEKDVARVWLSLPDLIDWDDITGYVFFLGKMESNENELTSENAYHFLETNKIEIRDFKDFRKCRIVIQSSTRQHENHWTFEECLYAQIEYNGKQYVYNNKKYYEINADYVTEINNRFKSLAIENPLSDNTITQTEAKYIKQICTNDINKICLDTKCVQFQTKIEICDIFDKSANSFIHIKKYASSAVLSHLFSQAFVSADLFADLNCQDKIIKRIQQEDQTFNGNMKKNDCNIVIAIMTVKKIKSNCHVELPFFSKLNLISTIEKINKMGYKSAKVMYIYSSAPLYNKEEVNSNG